MKSIEILRYPISASLKTSCMQDYIFQNTTQSVTVQDILLLFCLTTANKSTNIQGHRITS